MLANAPSGTCVVFFNSKLKTGSSGEGATPTPPEPRLSLALLSCGPVPLLEGCDESADALSSPLFWRDSSIRSTMSRLTKAQHVIQVSIHVMAVMRAI